MRLPIRLVVVLGFGAVLGVLLLLLFFATLLAEFNDEGGRPLRAATIDDLPHMVLQPQDLPDEYVQLTENEFSKLKTTGEYGSIASYETAFELPRDGATPGETVCIGSLAALYPTADAAQAALSEPIRQLEDAARRGDEAGSRIQELRVVQPTPDPPRAVAAIFYNPSASFCAAYETEPAYIHLVRFDENTLVGTITMYVYQHGSTSDDAMELARLQLGRMLAGR